MKLRDLRRLARSAKRPNIAEPTLPTPGRAGFVSRQPPPSVRVHASLLGPDGKEVTYAGYKRVALTLRDVDGLFMNTERLDFPAAASPADVKSVVLATESEATAKVTLDKTFHVPTGEQPFFAPGELKVVFDPEEE